MKLIAEPKKPFTRGQCPAAHRARPDQPAIAPDVQRVPPPPNRFDCDEPRNGGQERPWLCDLSHIRGRTSPAAVPHVTPSQPRSS